MTQVLDPPSQHTPRWPDVRDVLAPDTRVLAGAAAAAVITDLALRSGAGIGAALLFAVLTGIILGSGRATNRRAWPVLALAPAVGLWLAVRRSGWLLPFDAAAATALLVVGSTFARSGDPRDLTLRDLLVRSVQVVVHGMLAPAFLAAALPRSRGDQGRALFGVTRGAVLAAPVVLLVALLLASADPVFASFFRVPTDAADAVLHLLLLGIGGWTGAGLLRIASASRFDVPRSTRRTLGAVEALTVLSALVTVFVAYAVSQVIAVVGGADYVRRTAGVSYATYARSGFFQLLAVAAITLAVLLALRSSVDLSDRVTRHRFLVIAEAAVVLTLVVVAGAVRRLSLYEEAYGLTMLRLFSVVFALWIAVLFLLLAWSLTGPGGRRAWFLPAAVVTAVLALLGLNVANPEALVVRRNVERFAGTDKLDVWYLTSLSDDAVPELVRALPGLPPEQADTVRSTVCHGEREATGGVFAYNASRTAAATARRGACGGTTP